MPVELNMKVKLDGQWVCAQHDHMFMTNELDVVTPNGPIVNHGYPLCPKCGSVMHYDGGIKVEVAAK